MPVLINLIDSSDESDEDEVPAAAQQPPPPAAAQQPPPPAAAQQPSQPAAAQQPAAPAAAPQPVPPAAAQAPQLAGPSSARPAPALRTQPSQGAAASSSSRMESAGLMRLVAASARPDAEGRGAAGQHGRRDEPGGGGREARLSRDARRPVADAILFLPKLPHSVDRDALRRLFSVRRPARSRLPPALTPLPSVSRRGFQAFGTVVDVSRSHRSGTVCFQTGAEAKRALAAVSAATPSPEAAAAEPLPLCVDSSSVARVTQVSAPEYAPEWSPPLPALRAVSPPRRERGGRGTVRGARE